MIRVDSHLDSLENHSVFILREANHAFKNLAMPWSMGKERPMDPEHSGTAGAGNGSEAG